MIHARFTSFRRGFAVTTPPFNTIDIDGLPTWPLAKMRANGFANSITLTAWSFPPDPQPNDPAGMTVTCNGGATDAASGTTFDWYLSQRTDMLPRQVLSVTQPFGNKSGTLFIATSTNAPKLVPSRAYLEIDALTKLFKHTVLYAQRQSDKSIQLLNLAAALGVL